MEGSQLNNFTQQHKGNVQVEFIASDRYCQSNRGVSVNQQPVLLKIKFKKKKKRKYCEAMTGVYLVCVRHKHHPERLAFPNEAQ